MSEFRRRLDQAYANNKEWRATPKQIADVIHATNQGESHGSALQQVGRLQQTISPEEMLMLKAVHDDAGGLTMDVVAHIYLQLSPMERNLSTLVEVIEDILNELQHYTVKPQQLKIGHIRKNNVLAIHTRR